MTPTTAPAPRARRSSTARSLARLYPYARPAVLPMVFSALTAGVAVGCVLLSPLIIGMIVDGPVAAGDVSALWWPGLALLGVGIAEAALFFVRRIIIARPAMRVESHMRVDLYDKLQRLPVSFHDRWPAGQLLSRAVSDLATIRRFLSFALIFLLINIATFAIGVAILVVIDYRLGLIVAALAVPLVGISLLFEGRYRILSRRAQDQVGDLATLVEESVLGIRILKSFGRGAHFSRRFLRAAEDLRTTQLTKATVLSWLWAAIVALPEIALAGALLLGIRFVADGSLTIGALMAFFGVAMALRWPVDSIGWLLAIANETAAATDRFYEVMDAEEPLLSPDHPIAVRGSAADPDRAPAELAFRDVHFAFADARPGEPPVLRGVDLVISPGETVALVGATGSGKTVITALANRLHDVSAGAITLAGVDIRDMDLADLRRRVAVTFEEPTLFSASVRENILFGQPDGTDADVDRALAIAQATFCYDLPHGLDTRIGEQGLALSGGQRQRLALARAIASRPQVLVLDDPLSALDIHTEAAVERALRSVLADTTALIVAHRASTVLLADRVALLADGRITATGTHSELLATVPAYADLLSGADSRPAA